ncbi:MAG: type II toxin-antitoxin system VapC family toxin [Nitrosomonadales bacterium]|nr:type II toxin-antitoxin system VapC family toxin [Nitrosomonadales bacterium]
MIYLDTSALLKRYIMETGSDAFEDFFAEQAPLHSSRLTLVEARSALARRRRTGQITRKLESSAFEELRTDLQDGVLVLHALADSHATHALHLLEKLPKVPLRALDALHLSVAQEIGATKFATSDRNQGEAARLIGFELFFFEK